MAHLQMRASIPSTGWRALKIGGGGFLVGGEIAADGTRVCRTDTYGAYLWSSAASSWSQLVTSASMPVGEYDVSWGEGVYEIRIAPSNTNIFYMSFRGYVYKSTDRGTTWTKTNFSQVNPHDPNDSYRYNGSKMAIDPNDPDHVIVGSPEDGAWRTTNGGTSWALISDVPVSSGGGHAVAFVDSSNIFVSCNGDKVYRSTDGGSTFSATTSGPASIANWVVSSAGVLFACAYPESGDNVWKFASGSWTQLTAITDGGYHAVACDLSDPTHVIVCTAGTTWTNQSFDSGATWTGPYFAGSPATVTLAAGDVPWIASAADTYLSNGNMVYDPIDEKLCVFMGTGFLKTTHPTTYTGSSDIVWTPQTAGIEQLVTSIIISPPGGYPIGACQDRPLWRFTNPGNYPSDYGPDYTHKVIHCWSVDYASSDPTYLAAIVNKDDGATYERSCYSTNGGVTWTQFAAKPANVTGAQNKFGGCIAASTSTNLVWVPSRNGSPYYTKDGGSTWTEILLSGVPTHPSETGWGFSQYTRRQIVAADRVTANKFYLYNYGASGDGGGVWVSTDSGDNWARVFSGPIDSFSAYSAALRAVPGHANHLVFTSGQVGSLTDANPNEFSYLYKSTDGGTNWSTVPNVQEVYDFSFGKQIGSGYDPTVFIVGWVSSVYGIWYSTDFDQATPTWTKIGDYPLNSFDHIKTISGDMNTAGKCYVGFNGSGYAYYTP